VYTLDQNSLDKGVTIDSTNGVVTVPQNLAKISFNETPGTITATPLIASEDTPNLKYE
jgi:hypothetical protein